MDFVINFPSDFKLTSTLQLKRIRDWSSEIAFRISNNDTNSLAIRYNNTVKLLLLFYTKSMLFVNSAA